MTLHFPDPAITRRYKYEEIVYLWDGVAWHIDRNDFAAHALQRAAMVTLTYTGTQQQAFDLRVADIRGNRYTLKLQPPQELVEVFLNGVRMVLDDGTGTVGDFTVDYAANSVVFVQPVDATDTVQIDVLTPPELLSPGSVNIHTLEDLDVDWSDPAQPTDQIDGVRNDFPMYYLDSSNTLVAAVAGGPNEIVVYVDGVRQRPHIDYTTAGSRLQFTVPPSDHSEVWAQWFEPGGGGGGQGVNPPQPPLDAITDSYKWIPGTGLTWADDRGGVILVADEAERMALRYPEDIDDGALVVQQDNGWTYRFSSSDKVRRPPAVTLRYGPTTPTATNPINPIDFIFTGLPAAEETIIVNHSILLDSNTGKTSQAVFQFTLDAGDDINAALAKIQAVLPPRGLTITAPDTIRDDLPPNLAVMDAFIDAWSPPDPAAPISTANWNVFSDYITLPTFADAEDLVAKGEIRDGMTVRLPNEQRTVLWQHGGWREIHTDNHRPHILSGLVHDPELPIHSRLDWTDLRTRMHVVDDLPDLSDRTELPYSHMTIGKLVFVKATGMLYELVVEPDSGAMTDTLADWKPMAGGVSYVGGMGQLPDPTVDRIANGQMFVVTMDFGGKPLERLVAWDETLPGRPGPTPTAITVTLVPGATASDPLDIDFDDAGGTDSVYDREVAYDITVAGQQAQGTITVPKGSRAVQFARELEQALSSLGSVALVTRAGGTVTITPNPGNAIQAGATVTLPPPNTAATPGGWRFLNRHVWSKGLRTDDDQQTDQRDGDFQFTAENEHVELKIWDNGAWRTIVSDDDINRRIASLSLFEGTVQEPGGTVAGAIELDKLPNLWPMEQLGDLGKTSHYWVYTGTPGYTVKDGAEEKQEATAAGQNFGDITLTTTPAQLPAAAGQNIQMNFAVGGNGQVEVDKFFVTQIALTDANGDKQAYEVRQNIFTAGGLAPMDAEKLASQAANQWNEFAAKAGLRRAFPAPPLPDDPNLDPQTEFFFTHNAGDAFFTINVPDGWTFELFDSQDGGTPAVGATLAGTQLQVGDWIQIANRGGDGSGQGANGGPPDLTYVRIGGDLLTKTRGDGLYGLKDYARGIWEAGSVVVSDGEVFRASKDITPQDAAPVAGQIDITVGTVRNNLAGGALDELEPQPGDGDVEIATAAGTIPGGTAPFQGQNYAADDVFIYSDNPLFAGSGQTPDGQPYDQGWIKLGQVPHPTGGGTVPVTPDPGASPWERVDISGGLKVAQDDQSLPNTAPAGQVWIVLDSAQAGGRQALFSFDAGANLWTELGGGGKPMDLSGGVQLISVGVPVGSITAFAGTTVPQGWLLCDGSAFDTNTYKDLAQVLGTDHVPDLVDQFIRGAAAPESGFTQHGHKTALPVSNDFTGVANSAGSHAHNITRRGYNTDAGWLGGDAFWTTYKGSQHTESTENAGDHTHTVTINGGGDTETVPKHVKMAYIIKAADTFIEARTV